MIKFKKNGEKEMKETIKAKVLEAVKEIEGKNKLTCSEALKIASELKVSPKEIGDYCNENKIKLHSCQLGCF